MNKAGRTHLRGFLLAFLIFFLLLSCSSRKVLVLTDPYWEDFSPLCGSHTLTRGLVFLKNGLIPVFETYRGDDQDFPVWLEDILEKSQPSSISVTYPYLRFSQILQNKFLPLTVLQLNGSPGGAEYSYGIARRRNALENAAVLMREKYEQDGALPILILYKNDAVFNEEYQAVLRGWGSDMDFPEKGVLFLEQGNSDINGHILRFFNSFDWENNSYTLLAIPDRFLPNLIDLWPEGQNITAILTSPDYDFLPDNVKYLIYPDLQGLLEASAEISSGRVGEEILYVESDLHKR